MNTTRVVSTRRLNTGPWRSYASSSSPSGSVITRWVRRTDGITSPAGYDAGAFNSARRSAATRRNGFVETGGGPTSDTASIYLRCLSRILEGPIAAFRRARSTAVGVPESLQRPANSSEHGQRPRVSRSGRWVRAASVVYSTRRAGSGQEFPGVCGACCQALEPEAFLLVGAAQRAECCVTWK